MFTRIDSTTPELVEIVEYVSLWAKESAQGDRSETCCQEEWNRDTAATYTAARAASSLPPETYTEHC